MKDYRLYEVADFVLDEDFIRWVYKKNDNDTLSWNKWLAENPGKHLAVAEDRRILESVEIVQSKISFSEIQEEKKKLLATIKKPEEQLLVHVSFFAKKWLRYAAMIIVLAGTAAIAYRLNKNVISQVEYKYSYASLIASKKHLIEHRNTSASNIKIAVPDGSTVVLYPNSILSYEDGIDTASVRNVYLSGEAFFEVAKNPKKPFKVYANEIVTKVLGTSFIVRAFENDKSATVTVKTGKVSVYSEKENIVDNGTSLAAKPGGMLLMPNQQAVYSKSQNKFEKTLLEKPEILVSGITAQNFIYEDASVVSVLEQMKKCYGIDIVYDADVLKNCTITADLTDESLARKMDLLCKCIGAEYEMTDGEIIIQSKGCK